MEKALEKPQKVVLSKPLVSFTFDDGNTSNLAGFQFEEWNKMILSHLENENLKAVFFITGWNKSNTKGQFLLKSWNDNGHKIANHSFSHPNFNSEKNTSQVFENELIKTDSIISKLSNRTKLFRFPYLKEGQNQAKVDNIRNILSKHNYLNGYVTIDASDWYIDQRLIRKIKEVGFENVEIDKFKDFYVQHIFERANYYEKLSYEMNGRHVNHTLLLHHNLTSALFLDDLIKKFKEQGWEIIDADNAFQDEIFKSIPKSNFAGESLIYSMAKQSGKHDHLLRYPAEDGQYEKGKMDKLGL
ncbi:polysaccharide deacetylase family protein [Aquimarina sp. 2201CG5-10]|uniref:polysaccharide deacetylase family protein n=1 Tax=Aquimarina callyspongiae TaxID=3098150 RepID=UPI002AB5AC38|nr:polysaccharide deacetylase family protein [Aquimarina sp. 2201CG5-10]MDY8135414.1 polysaccharide deacetylase family protein [Aquimarina sp. 2201CG5-10]